MVIFIKTSSQCSGRNIKDQFMGWAILVGEKNVGSKSPENQTVENALDVFLMDLLVVQI